MLPQTIFHIFQKNRLNINGIPKNKSKIHQKLNKFQLIFENGFILINRTLRVYL